MRIIEGRQLSGSNISPVVRVLVANHTRQTKVKHSTNKPFFDEVTKSIFVVKFCLLVAVSHKNKHNEKCLLVTVCRKTLSNNINLELLVDCYFLVGLGTVGWKVATVIYTL